VVESVLQAVNRLLTESSKRSGTMTEQTQVGSRPAMLVSDTVLEQLQRVADTQGIAANELAEQAIRHFLREERRQLLQRESEAFCALHEQLLATHAGEFVAIYDGRLVDYDRDQESLLLRLDTNFPTVPVLIKQVLPDPQETYLIRSPRFVCESNVLNRLVVTLNGLAAMTEVSG
jgi:hypothetical protein